MSEYYSEKLIASLDYANRYKDCKILINIDTGESLLATREPSRVYAHQSDIYHRVKNNEVNRLDLIAYKYYKNPMLWWVIAQANEIYDPFIPIDAGILLRIPSIESLYGNQGMML